MKTVRLLGRYPLTLTCIVAIWVLCLMNVPETPLDNVAFIDKWTHLVMYGGTCSVGWWEYIRHNHTQWRLDRRGGQRRWRATGLRHWLGHTATAALAQAQIRSLTRTAARLRKHKYSPGNTAPENNCLTL